MDTTSLFLIFVATSNTFNLPPGLLKSVCYVESTHNVKALHHNDGGATSLGICQIKLSTAKLLKFKGTEEELMKPQNNIHYAGKYLAHQLKRYDKDIVMAVSAYNAGSYRRNALGKAKNQKYVDKVFNVWAQRYQ